MGPEWKTAIFETVSQAVLSGKPAGE